MARPKKPNIKRIAFQRQCMQQLEKYLEERDMSLNEKELLLDLAGLVDFLEEGNYVGAHYLGSVLLERLEKKVPEWDKLRNSYVSKDFTIPDIQLDPE